MTAQAVTGVIAELSKLIAVCEKAASDERRVLLDPAAVLPIAKSAHSSLESQAQALSEARESAKGQLVVVNTAVAERERTERNRDMWKGQCERQAEQLTTMRSRLAEAMRVVVSLRDWLILAGDMTCREVPLSIARDFLNAAKEKT